MALPNEIHPFAIAGGGNQYQVANSLRFRASNSAFLSRTPASASNRKTWTWSGWVKKSNATTNGTLFAARTAVGATYLTVVMTSAGDFRMESNSETAYPLYKTNALFRDPAAWYHFVVALDMTQATSTDRLKVWVNGVLQTTASYNVPAQNTDLAVNSTETHLIGQQASGGYFDGYMAEVNFIDGQALTPSSFGQTDSVTGQWVPKKYTSTYGTNGFYLPFNDATSTTTLGYDRQLSMTDSSKNNWTSSGISVTSGITYDSMIDSPTNYNDGSTTYNRGSYATLNPLSSGVVSGSFYADRGNLRLVVTDNSGYRNLLATFSPENFKGYFEVYCSSSPNWQIGFADATLNPASGNYITGNAYYLSSGDGNVSGPTYLTTIKSACTSAFSTNDVLMVAFDFTGSSRNVWFGRNGTWGSNSVGVGVPSTGTNPVLTASNMTVAQRFYFAANLNGGYDVNFGQRPFTYTPPTGFLALNTYNLANPSLPLV